MKKKRRLISLAAIIDRHLNQFEAIDLKKSGEDDCPSYSSYSPTMYISGRKDSKVFDMPKAGKATIDYRVRSKSVNYRENGEETYSTDIEVTSIEPRSTDFQAILARYDFADGRARDPGGRYSPGNEPPSPEDNAIVYGRRKRKAIAVGTAGAAAMVASALPGARKRAANIGAGALRAIAGLR